MCVTSRVSVNAATVFPCELSFMQSPLQSHYPLFFFGLFLQYCFSYRSDQQSTMSEVTTSAPSPFHCLSTSSLPCI